MSKVPHIDVCICTFRRPRLLRKLLEALARQRTEGLFTFSAVVVDNDVAESARTSVRELAENLPYPVIYCIEPVQNISLTRNRALANAQGSFIAFIDDDEYPEDNWLLTLYKTCVDKGVDAVLGPVKPHYEVEPPFWVKKGKFYDRPAYPTGFVTDWRKGRTGNLLFRRAILDGVEAPFRREFTTGEDQDFTRRMMERGYRFFWCNEAVAYEAVPPVRWDLRFMVRRALLRGKVSVRQSGTGLASVLKSMLAIAVYSLSLPVTLVFGMHVFVRCTVSLCDHLGKVLSYFGLNFVKEQYVTE